MTFSALAGILAEPKIDSTTLALIITTAGSVLIALFSLLTGASKNSVESLNKIIKDLRENYDALKTTVDLLTADNTRLSCDNENLRVRVATLENSALLTSKKIIELEHENVDLKNEVIRLTKDNLRLEKENKDLLERIQQLEHQQAGE